jgi:hypothetical protein
MLPIVSEYASEFGCVCPAVFHRAADGQRRVGVHSPGHLDPRPLLVVYARLQVQT